VATRVADLRIHAGDYASLDDRLLVLDFQAGQPEAFVEIHRRYGHLARHVCTKFLPNRADADEAFQETMIRVFQGLHRFNGRYALQPWIARIATNVSLDQIRTRARRPHVEHGLMEEVDHADPADGPEQAVERLVERDLVLSVLAGLPESHRTALVLRELEGRSHKEIARTLAITPAQAKALIHRAKGTFRRAWLKAITERGGFAGIAVLPLLVLARLVDNARRLAEKVGGHATQVAQAATPEMVSSAASSPTVVTAASSISERVVAAGMTLLVAGSVTVGAATIKGRIDRVRTERAAAPAVVAPSEAPAAPSLAPSPEPAAELPEKKAGAPNRNRPKPAESPEVVVPPVVDPSEDPSPSPSTDPSGGPSPSPTPTIPPAPAWTYELTASTQSVELCECDGSSTASTKRIQGVGDGAFSFNQAIRGGARDSGGDLTWPFVLQQWGIVGPDGGSVEYRLTLTSSAGLFLYYGSAILVERVENADGSTTYRFEGTFGLLDAGAPAPGLPSRGFVSATVGVWQDGTIHTGSFSLVEAQT
jgi:RNA polymerase sigma-70 factor (ECF subfamily)